MSEMKVARRLGASLVVFGIVLLDGCTEPPKDAVLRQAQACLESCTIASAASHRSEGLQTLREAAVEHPNVVDLADTVKSWLPAGQGESEFNAEVLDSLPAYRAFFKGEAYDVYRVEAQPILMAHGRLSHVTAAIMSTGEGARVAGDTDATVLLLTIQAVQTSRREPTGADAAISTDERDRADQWLAALDGKVAISEIVKRPEPPKEKLWFVVNASDPSCFQSHGGPAQKLEDLSGGPSRPRTREFPGADGELSKVEVISDAEDGEHIWTYYRSKSECEDEEVNAPKALADRYR